MNGGNVILSHLLRFGASELNRSRRPASFPSGRHSVTSFCNPNSLSCPLFQRSHRLNDHWLGRHIVQ